jgi:hypothetical protein
MLSRKAEERGNDRCASEAPAARHDESPRGELKCGAEREDRWRRCERSREPSAITISRNEVGQYTLIHPLHDEIREVELCASRERWSIRRAERRDPKKGHARILERESAYAIALVGPTDVHQRCVDQLRTEDLREFVRRSRYHEAAEASSGDAF